MILITGCAGFIGFNLANTLCINRQKVIGIDFISKSTSLIKKDRLKILKRNKYFKFSNIDISKSKSVSKFFDESKIKVVIHLAAAAGVRESIVNPEKYFSSNLLGFFNIIESSKKSKVKKFIYASSSSVYDKKAKIPYKENDSNDNQISFYALTKKNNEQIAKYFSECHSMITIGLRFFSVYGPWGRPDMAYYKFTNLIHNNREIEVFNYGNHKRDFTYIDDVVNFIKILIKKNIHLSNKFSIFNIGNGEPIKLMTLIEHIEQYLGKKAKIKFMKKQIGDVHTTFADMQKSKKELNFQTKYSFDKGITNFIEWYLKNHKKPYN